MTDKIMQEKKGVQLKTSEMIQGVHCHWSSITNVFKTLVPEFLPSVVFLSEHGLQTQYQVKKAHDFSDLVLTNHLSRLYLQFFQRNGVEFHCYDADIPFSELLQRIKKENDRGFPVVISLFSKEIPYHAVYNSTSSNMHFVIVSAVKVDKLFVQDSFIPTHPESIFCGWVKQSQMELSWEKSVKKAYFFNESQVSLIRKMCCAGLEKDCLNAEIERYLDSGREGIDWFLRDFSECAENFPQTIRNNARLICFRLLFDSVVPSRKLLANALREIRDGLCVETHRLEEVIQEWYKITFSLMKYSYGHSNAGFIKTARRMGRVMEQERELLREILYKQ